MPVVFTATEPAEIILTNGAPTFSPIPSTKLLQVRNTDSTLFKDSGDNQFYYLVAGRWFRAASLEGPWSAATTDLPADFGQIPDDNPAAYVKASVPGTRDAEDALLYASIPTTNTVQVGDDTAIDVAYDGAPRFDEISGAPGVEYAANTANDVFLVKGNYYMCSQGVWYVSATATGPWSYATEVPPEIYSIPASHPAHNVTYVNVYNTTPSTVTYGYTSGYEGYYASQGVLMFGAGMLLGAAIADDDDHHHHDYHHYYPSYYSYGSGAVYHGGYGGYYHGARAYGPYGGAGRSAWYDPHTGAYSRSAYRTGPNGAAYARSGYNPYTDTYAARAGATTRYGSAGRFYAERDGEAVRGGHRTGAQGSVRWAQGSEGQAAVAARGRYDQGLVARNKDGNVYVGNDGNVYKRNDEGNWQRRQGGEWQDYERSANANATRTRSAASTPSRSTSASSVDQSRTRTASTSASSGSQSSTARQLDRDAQARDWGNRQANRTSSASANRSYSGSRASSSYSGSRASSSGASRSRGASRGGGGRRR
jgi:hypothetical protein